MGIAVDRIVPWGRSRREYEVMFRLSAEDLRSKVLDCGAGPASFVGELNAQGYPAVGVDPLYSFPETIIRIGFEQIVETMRAQIKATPGDWVWKYHRDADDLCANRRTVLDRFLTDFARGQRNGWYINAALPHLPFEQGTFGLVLCSHLLFLYSEVLSEEFHIEAVRELCRVGKEVRIFPLLCLNHHSSPHLEPVRLDCERRGWRTEIETVDYELMRGGNQMLRIWRAA
jgi:SAM-dependent methyltransferase